MKHLFLKTMLILATTFNSSCEEYNTNESTGGIYDPYSETGNDTFSCYINGKKYIPKPGKGKAGGKGRAFNWSYGNFGKLENPYTFSMGGGAVSIVLRDPELGKNILDEHLRHSEVTKKNGMHIRWNEMYYYTIAGQNNGSVTFTELTKTRAIGTFECTLYRENEKELKVTKGKFNLSVDSISYTSLQEEEDSKSN